MRDSGGGWGGGGGRGRTAGWRGRRRRRTAAAGRGGSRCKTAAAIGERGGMGQWQRIVRGGGTVRDGASSSLEEGDDNWDGGDDNWEERANGADYVDAEEGDEIEEDKEEGIEVVEDSDDKKNTTINLGVDVL